MYRIPNRLIPINYCRLRLILLRSNSGSILVTSRDGVVRGLGYYLDVLSGRDYNRGLNDPLTSKAIPISGL